MVDAVPSLRQRHAQRTRRAIVDAALSLFRDQGFASTTIEEISERADIAPRTFYRYFSTKEAVVYHDAAEVVSTVRALLVARPADEPPHRSLLGVLTEMGEVLAADGQSMLLIHQLSDAEPGLLGYQRVLLQQFEQEIVATLAAHRGVAPDLDLRVTSAVLLSSLGVAFQAWIDGGAKGSLRPYITQAVEACRRAFTEEVTDQKPHIP